MEWTKDDIQFLIENYEKYGPTFISKRLNRDPKSISSKARRMNIKYNSSSFYESSEFDKLVGESKNIVDICRNIGIKLTGGNRETIKKWIRIKNIDISHFIIERGTTNYKSNNNLFLENSTSDRRTIKEKLYRDKIKERKCEICGQGEEWMGKKMSLILDHINGINNDNRIENLRILCPNCNSTLDTNGGKNIKNKLKQEMKKTFTYQQLQQQINRID